MHIVASIQYLQDTIICLSIQWLFYPEESKKRISTIVAWAMANSTGALSSREYRSPKVCPSTAFCISVFGTLGGDFAC